MKIWKEAKTVELDIHEIADLLSQNFHKLAGVNFELLTLKEWIALVENLDGLHQMAEAVLTKIMPSN